MNKGQMRGENVEKGRERRKEKKRKEVSMTMTAGTTSLLCADLFVLL